MTAVIGITGRAGAGKDTFATMLHHHFPTYTRYAFANPLKMATEFMFGWPRAMLEDRDLKEQVDPKWGFSPRRAMQLLGTEFGRTLRQDLWLHFAQLKLDESEGMIVTDVRFENEAAWVRERGILIHVYRPDNNLAIDGSHASEAGVTQEPNDYLVMNTGDLDDLRTRAIEVVEDLNTRGL